MRRLLVLVSVMALTVLLGARALSFDASNRDRDIVIENQEQNFWKGNVNVTISYSFGNKYGLLEVSGRKHKRKTIKAKKIQDLSRKLETLGVFDLQEPDFPQCEDCEEYWLFVKIGNRSTRLHWIKNTEFTEIMSSINKIVKILNY